jgi:hypothetical protein
MSWSLVLIAHSLGVSREPPVVGIIGAELPGRVSSDAPSAEPHGAWPEAPAWALTLGGRTRYYFSTAWTFAVEGVAGKNPVVHAGAFDPEGVTLATQDAIRRSDFAPPEELDPAAVWRRNYYGVFSAHRMEHPGSGEPGVLTIQHGENKNEAFPYYERRYANTVLPGVEYGERDYSGFLDGEYQDYWPGYFGFIGAAWAPLRPGGGNALMAGDLGPILWPQGGYLDEAGEKASSGLRHPSSIVHDGFIYVFYLEAPAAGGEAKHGIKLARGPVSSGGRPGSFRTWHDGAFEAASLPEGFRKERAPDFLDVPGPPASNVHPELGWGLVRFSVARVEGTPYFLSVEERLLEGVSALYLRASRDLTSWGEAVAVPGTRLPWGEGLHYPLLANAAYTSNTEIDAEGFYLLGSASAKMKALRLSVRIRER